MGILLLEFFSEMGKPAIEMMCCFNIIKVFFVVANKEYCFPQCSNLALSSSMNYFIFSWILLFNIIHKIFFDFAFSKKV